MEALLEALSNLLTTQYWVALFIAIGVGTLVGFIPGVGATLVTAIMLPTVLLLVDEPAVGIVFLAMVGSLNNTLDSIPAVLVGVPGSETQVTYLEGHQLARKGLAAHTLGAVYAVSALGGVIGAIALALVIPIIKPFILQFSYTEIATLALFGIAMVALLSRGGMAKGLAAGALGLLFGTIGVDPFSGTDRYTMGQLVLWEGLPLVTTIIGFFALPELIDLTMTRESVAASDSKVSRAEVFRGARHGLSRWRMVIRQSLFGTFMGAVPGIGGSVIDWLAYAFGISLTRDKSKYNFGKGELEGVLFAESANNAKAGGQALPTLTLGIPGSTSWAIIAVAILSYGFSPGPSMVTQHQDITMLMVITLALGNVIVAGIGLFATNWLARITRIPYPTVGFMIMGMVFLASYLDLSQWLVFPILAAFTVLGLVMKRYRWPRPPLLLGFILGPIVEQNLLSALSLYGVVGVLTRPIAVGLIIFMIISVVTLLRLTSTKTVDLGDVVIENPMVEDDDSDDQDGSGVAVAQQVTAPARTTTVRERILRNDNMVPVLLIALATAFLVRSFDFPNEARTLPMTMSTAVILFCGYQLIKQVTRGLKEDEDIMDLGMRSTDMEGTRQAGWMIVGMFGLFLGLAGTVGLQIAAIALAAVGPVVFLQGRARWISMVTSGLVVGLFAEVLMDRYIGIIWPDPFILSWLGLVS